MTVNFQSINNNNYKNVRSLDIHSNKSAVCFGNKTPKTDEIHISSKTKKTELSTFQKALVAAASIVSTAAICIAIIKKPDEMQKLRKGFSHLKGNNAFVEESAKKYSNAVEEMVSAGKEDYNIMLEKVKSLLKPCKEDLVPSDGIVYHGTSMENASKIGKTGITPYAPSEHGAEFGRAIYTTPDKRVADYISTEYNFNGVVLPFKLNTKNIAHVSQDTIVQMHKITTDYYIKYAPKTQSFADSGVELPTFADNLIASLGTSSDNLKFLKETRAIMMNRLFRDAGYDAAYMEKAIESDVKPLFGAKITDTLEKEKGINQSQIAIFDGTKIEALPEMFTKGKKIE